MEVLSQIEGVRGLLRSARSVALLSAAMVVAIAATAGLMIWHGHEAARDEHLRAMNSMGVVLAEQTRRYTQVIDLILQDVQSRITSVSIADPAAFQATMRAPAMHEYLSDRLKNVPQVANIDFADVDGRILNWSLNQPVRSVSLADRDYFQFLRDHDDPGLFVGALGISRSIDKPSLFFARRVNGPDGRFLGVAVAIVDISNLVAFYEAAGEHVTKETVKRPPLSTKISLIFQRLAIAFFTP